MEEYKHLSKDGRIKWAMAMSVYQETEKIRRSETYHDIYCTILIPNTDIKHNDHLMFDIFKRDLQTLGIISNQYNHGALLTKPFYFMTRAEFSEEVRKLLT